MELAEQELIVRIARDEGVYTLTGSGAYWQRFLRNLMARTGGTEVFRTAEILCVQIPKTQLRIGAKRRGTSRQVPQRRPQTPVNDGGSDTIIEEGL